MKRFVFLFIMVCCPFFAHAADIPEVVNANRANNFQTCVDNATNECVNITCINSEDRPCPDEFPKAAENKCKAMSQ